MSTGADRKIKEFETLLERGNASLAVKLSFRYFLEKYCSLAKINLNKGQTLREFLIEQIYPFLQADRTYTVESNEVLARIVGLADASGSSIRNRIARILSMYYLELYEPVRFDSSFVPDAARVKQYLDSLASIFEEVRDGEK